MIFTRNIARLKTQEYFNTISQYTSNPKNLKDIHLFTEGLLDYGIYNDTVCWMMREDFNIGGNSPVLSYGGLINSPGALNGTAVITNEGMSTDTTSSFLSANFPYSLSDFNFTGYTWFFLHKSPSKNGRNHYLCSFVDQGPQGEQQGITYSQRWASQNRNAVAINNGRGWWTGFIHEERAFISGADQKFQYHQYGSIVNENFTTYFDETGHTLTKPEPNIIGTYTVGPTLSRSLSTVDAIRSASNGFVDPPGNISKFFFGNPIRDFTANTKSPIIFGRPSPDFIEEEKFITVIGGVVKKGGLINLYSLIRETIGRGLI